MWKEVPEKISSAQSLNLFQSRQSLATVRPGQVMAAGWPRELK